MPDFRLVSAIALLVIGFCFLMSLLVGYSAFKAKASKTGCKL